MNELEGFKREGHGDNLKEFLATESGQKFQNVLRSMRSLMTSSKECSDPLVKCGRYDVFHALDDLLFVAQSPAPITRQSQTKKGGAVVPAKTKLP